MADEALRWMAARPHAGVAAQVAVQPANDVTVEQLLEGLQRSNLAITLFDPQERLVFANRSFVAMHCGGAGDAQTWEDILRAAHQHRRGLRIDPTTSKACSPTPAGATGRHRGAYRMQRCAMAAACV